MEFVEQALEVLKKNNLYRTLRCVAHQSSGRLLYEGKSYINFSSNNYLSLAQDERVLAKAQDGLVKFGAGSGSSRLIAGTTEAHLELEKKLALFKHTESALVFPTGYMTNIGLITALASKDDAVIIDRLNHASIIDAVYLSKAKLYVYPHRDMDALKKLLER
jgi:7-keto-8-aminopelargonate synthetase-like enzyme